MAIKRAIIGLGECGSNIVKKWSIENKEIPTVTINSSKNDHEKTVGVKYRYLIREGSVGGMAGERERVKSVLKEDPELMKFIKSVLVETGANHFTIVSSLGGGTGSGCIPVIADILANKLKMKTRAVLVAPFADTDLKSLENTVTCLGDIYNLDAEIAIRIVSNKNVTSTNNHMVALNKVNSHIVETEEKVFQAHNLVSSTTNIDETEMSRLLYSKGYSPIYRVSTVGVKDVNDAILTKISNSLDMSLNMDGTIERLAILSYMKEHKVDMRSLRENIGDPDMCLTPLFTEDDSQEVYCVVGGANIPNEFFKYKEEFLSRQEKRKGFQTMDFSISRKTVDKSFAVEEKEVVIEEQPVVVKEKAINLEDIDFDAFL